MTSKVERRTKPKVTNLDRARTRAANRAKTRKVLNAETNRRLVEQIPEFLKVEANECEAYRVPDVFRQPDISPAPSGILYAKGYKHRDFVPRDQTRTGILLCILSGVVLGCIVAAVLS